METQVVEYNVTDAAIAEMKDMYMGLLITDLDDKEQYDAVHKAHMVVRGKRIEVDKKRKELKADALAWGKKVQTEANRIFALIEPIESHLKGEKQKVKDEEERLEKERIADIQEKLDSIRKFDANFYHATSHELKSIIETIESIEITPEIFFEFTTEANELKQRVLISTCQALEDREKRDKEEAERKAQEEQLARERAALEKAKAERESEEAKLAEERRKIQEEKDRIEAEKRAEQERKDREEFERQAKIKAEAEAKAVAERAEQERIAREEAEKAEAERQKALLPDKEKLILFADRITALTSGNLVIDSEDARKLFSDVLSDIMELDRHFRIEIDEL